jgi:hypothetical protein
MWIPTSPRITGNIHLAHRHRVVHSTEVVFEVGTFEAILMQDAPLIVVGTARLQDVLAYLPRPRTAATSVRHQRQYLQNVPVLRTPCQQTTPPGNGDDWCSRAGSWAVIAPARGSTCMS